MSVSDGSGSGAGTLFRVERFFSRIKHCRRIATRYEKLVETFMGFVKLASIMLWLR